MLLNKSLRLGGSSNCIAVVRNYSKRYSWDESAVSFDGFKYYKRFENETDPPIKPSKLFLVKRIKPFKGNPYWEKKIMKDFKIDEKEIAILKNIPENNHKLFRIKHLVEITPINFPNGEPTEDDLKYCWLRDNGDFMITKKLFAPEEQKNLTENYKSDQKRIDGNTLRRQSRQKWLDGW